MFQSLPQFYNSNEWKLFRRQLINDRTNKADGVLYDEITKQPLLKSFDIVAHHKTPLTMQNVNDFSISLNPENVILISQDTHNKEHKRFGYATERKVYYVYGAPCSGKTTFVNSIKGNADIVVDMDNIWQCITGTRYEKPNALKTNAFKLRDCLLDMIKTRAGKWERAWVISSEGSSGVRERTIEKLGAEPIYIEATFEECLKRLYENPNGRNIDLWKEFIRRFFDDDGK